MGVCRRSQKFGVLGLAPLDRPVDSQHPKKLIGNTLSMDITSVMNSNICEGILLPLSVRLEIDRH